MSKRYCKLAQGVTTYTLAQPVGMQHPDTRLFTYLGDGRLCHEDGREYQYADILSFFKGTKLQSIK